MRARSFLRTVAVSGFAASFIGACASGVEDPADTGSTEHGDDVARAAARLPEAEILSRTDDGVATFIRGDLGQVGATQTDDRITAAKMLRPALDGALAPFRLTADDVVLRKLTTDENGYRHARYAQVRDGLDVIGGEVVVHVDVKGTVYAVNGTARGDFPSFAAKADVGAAGAIAAVAKDARYLGFEVPSARLVYLILADGAMHKAYEVVASGERGLDPARDKVYVDATEGSLLAVHPQIQFAENRAVYSANNGSSLPGTLKRSEGGAATSDVDINAAYDNTGDTWEAYHSFFGRDSYDNAGAVLKSSVHYSTNYCNAFWNGTQMVYGDGNTSQGCYPLARSVDVTAHELTHAVTENESGLVYSGESGGLNEAMSDIFGAFTEAWVDGNKTGTLAVSADTWKVGEDILPPALRYMNDPAADGSSLDYWTSSAGNVDVHYSSGIANLAFYLLSQGGTHPRGKSTVVVTGISMAKAIKVFYSANTNYLTSNATFASARAACLSAASALGLTQAEQNSVMDAWAAVGVGSSSTGGGGGGGGGNDPNDIALTSGVAVTGISDSTVGGQKFYKLVVPSGATSLSFVLSGGTGDADMYVKFGSRPTLTSYECRPYVNGNSETCTVTNIQTGTYYVMLNAYAAYSNTSLKGTYATGSSDDGVTILVNGVPVTGISGGLLSTKYWKVQTPAGAKLVVKISGGTGDADLYTRFGSKPTTSTYLCRPYLTGNTESCTVSSTSAGYYYVMLRGYAAYSGVTLSSSN